VVGAAGPPQVVAAPFSRYCWATVCCAAFAVTRWALGSAHAPGSTPDYQPCPAWRWCSPPCCKRMLSWARLGCCASGRLGQFSFRPFLGLVACAFLWFQASQLGRSALPQENLERAFYGAFWPSLLFAVNPTATISCDRTKPSTRRWPSLLPGWPVWRWSASKTRAGRGVSPDRGRR